MGSSIGNPLKKVTKHLTSVISDPFNVSKHYNTSMDALGMGSPAPQGFDPSMWNSMGSIEQQSGIKPPGYESLRDAEGNLKSQFKFDPYAGEATQALKQQAFAQGDSPWAKMQLQKQAFEQAGARDQAAKQALQAMGQGQAELARFGGLGGGARERLASGGSKNLMLAQQGLARQGIGQRMDIGAQDIARKQDLLGKFATGEAGAQEANIGALRADITGKQAFDQNRYNEQMRAWAANKSAEAQARAAASSGGGKK